MLEVKLIDKTNIYVNAKIVDTEYNMNVHYVSIKVDNQNSLAEGGPSSKAAVISLPASWADYSNRQGEITLSTTAIDTLLLANEVQVDSDNIYYVYLVNDGNFIPGTPCGQDSTYEVKAAWNDTRYLKQGLSYLKTFSDNCGKASPSPEFINFILQNKAMELANTVGNMTLLNSYWSNFTISASGVKSTSKCGCNG